MYKGLAAIAAVTVAFALALGPGVVQASSFELIRIVDRNTEIPEGVGNFIRFTDAAFYGDGLAFVGFGASQSGIYISDGADLISLADLNSPIPDGTGNFTSFEGMRVSGDRLAFSGFGTSQQGIYLFDGTDLTRVADRNTPIPDGSGNFTVFVRPELNDSKVAFRGLRQLLLFEEGIYLFDGTDLIRVADRNTPIPGGTGNFTFFFQPQLTANGVAFIAGGFQQRGIYLFDGTDLTRVADQNTPIPDGTGDFTAFDNMQVGGDRLAFSGFGTSQQGIYLFDGTDLTLVADRNTPIPDGTGNFISLSGLLISGSSVTFQGSGDAQVGLYMFEGGTLRRVVDRHMVMPGSSEMFAGFGSRGLSGQNLAFWASGNLGGQGIYVFDGTTVSRVVDQNTSIPEGIGTFSDLIFKDIYEADVAFEGRDAIGDQQGIYIAIPASAFTFAGFFRPVDNLPIINVAKAGSAIPVKFSLDGNYGLNILASGYPKAPAVACNQGDPTDVIDQVVTAGGSGLTYDATTDTYTYVWKTEKGWANTCRQLILRLSDGSDHIAGFRFTR